MNDDLNEQASATKARLENLLTHRARNQQKVASHTEEIRKLKIREMLAANEEYQKLQTEIRQVRRRLHFARCSISKKQLAVQSRSAKLEKAASELAQVRRVEEESDRTLTDLLDRSGRIEAEATAAVLQAMGLTLADQLPLPEGK